MRQQSFAPWRKNMFGMDTYGHQQQLADALDNLKPREIIMVLMWPESGKSTTIIDYICKKLAEDPNHRFCHVSESQSLTRKFVGRVKSRMTDFRENANYITTYGPFYEEGQEKQGKPWTKDYITVNKADHDEADYSLEARAWTSAAYGTRIDTLILDDIQSSRSLSQTDRMYQTIRQTYLTRGRLMRTIIVGTRLGPGDIYERILESGICSKVIIIPAQQPDGQPTCPEMWQEGAEALNITPKQFLEIVRDQVSDGGRDENTWYSTYQQTPRSNALSSFTEPMIEQAKNDQISIANITEVKNNIVAGWDPALGGGNSLLVAELGEHLSLLDLQLDYNLTSTEQMFSRIEDFAMRYHFNKLIVEINSQQTGFYNDVRLREMARTYGFAVIPHTTGRNKADPNIGVAGMPSSFLRGEIEIPWGNTYTRTRFQPLVDQLRSWRPDMAGNVLEQDTVMSLWFIWKYWMEGRKYLKQDMKLKGWNMRSLGYRPTETHSLVKATYG